MNLSTRITKDGRAYEIEVSFTVYKQHIEDLSINQVTRLSDEHDMDPVTFQNSLTQEEEDILSVECDRYASEYDHYIEEDITK